MRSQVRSEFGLKSAVAIARRLRAWLRRFVRRRRPKDQNEGEILTAFWWGHGRMWAEQEASSEDLRLVTALAQRIGRLRGPEAEAVVISELKTAWRSGQPNASEGFGWNEMNDQLPGSALVAFVRGAGSIQQTKG